MVFIRKELFKYANLVSCSDSWLFFAMWLSPSPLLMAGVYFRPLPPEDGTMMRFLEKISDLPQAGNCGNVVAGGDFNARVGMLNALDPVPDANFTT